MSEQDPQARDAVERATRMTTDNIKKLLEQADLDGDPSASLLSISERNELIEEVSRIIPAGNVVSFVFNGILTTKGRERDTELNASTARSHVKALYKGLGMMKDNLFYQLAFAGPATILSGYNMLLRLAGTTPEEFLPDGAWQFYVEFGLREDAARHHCETIAFQRLVSAKRSQEAQQLAAWMLSAISLINAYERLLAQFWLETVQINAIEESTGLTGLHKAWQALRPFAAPTLESDLTEHRERTFQQFCEYHLAQVSAEQWRTYQQQWFSPERQDERGRQSRAYVRQMSILRYLEAGEYSDECHSMPKTETYHIGIVSKGNYYLVDIPTQLDAPTIAHIYSQAEAILNATDAPIAEVDQLLARVGRSNQMKLRGTLDKPQRDAITQLRKAPIIINWDSTPRQQPLTQIRNRQRGVNDHALTLHRTDGSTVFDFSHIFFDGHWALATAEMLTNEAMRLLHLLPAQAPKSKAPTPLNLRATPKFVQQASRYPQAINNISAEYSIPLTALHQLRKNLFTRTNIKFTVNDLLVMYRTLYNPYYTPSESLQRALKRLPENPQTQTLIQNLNAHISSHQKQNPSLLIPIDASRHDPKERIFPITFRNPLPDLRQEHETLLSLLEQVKQRRLFGANSQAIDHFIEQRKAYLGYLKVFSDLMQRHREIATQGQSMGTAAIRLIAGLPQPMQKIADNIPGNLSSVNEAIKGEEVFSNVGQVVSTSSLTRFASAKDDNDKKVLVWGIMTDAHGNLYITLRDFRPPVLDFARAGYPEIAAHITQDYLAGYMHGLQRFAEQMNAIISASMRSGG